MAQGFINNDGPTHESQLGAVLLVVNPYVGFEMGYLRLDLGRYAHYKGDSNGLYKAQGVQLTAKLGYQSLTIWTFIPVWVVWYGVQTPSPQRHGIASLLEPRVPRYSRKVSKVCYHPDRSRLELPVD